MIFRILCRRGDGNSPFVLYFLLNISNNSFIHTFFRAGLDALMFYGHLPIDHLSVFCLYLLQWLIAFLKRHAGMNFRVFCSPPSMHLQFEHVPFHPKLLTSRTLAFIMQHSADRRLRTQAVLLIIYENRKATHVQILVIKSWYNVGIGIDNSSGIVRSCKI